MTTREPIAGTTPTIQTPDGQPAGQIIPAQTLPAPRAMAHLHQHTQYSMLDGAAKLKDLLKWVKKITPEGATACCAITDHGNMHGAVHFYNYARELGVKPILGCEFYVSSHADHRTPGGDTYHLTLLAQNFTGYQNLTRLNTIAYNEGFYRTGRISRALLAEYSEGIICLSGCVGAEIPQLILKGAVKEAKKVFEWYAATFPGRFFAEIQRHTDKCDEHAERFTEAELGYVQTVTSAYIKDWSRELGIGMVATNDGHYIERKDAAAHDVLLAIQQSKNLDDPGRVRFSCDAFYVKTPEEMQELLPVSEWGEELYDNSLLIAGMCEDDYLPVGKKRVYRLPKVASEGLKESELLCIQTFKGLAARYPSLDPNTEAGLNFWLTSARQAWTALSKDEQAEVRRRGARPASPPQIDNLWRFLAAAGDLSVMRAEQSGARLPELLMTGPATEDEGEHDAPALLRRAEYELSVINKMGFAGYFIIVAEYTGWARSVGISVGPGRGSGAGSIVAYALEITDIDPIKYRLLFERFLNPDRISMPDFDIDFDDVRRTEIIGHLIETYGEDRVSMIATFQSLKPRVALKDVARTMGIDFSTMNKLTSLIPEHQGKVTPLKEALKDIPDIGRMIQSDPRLSKVYDFAIELEGLSKARSTHAAGVIIGDEPLRNLVPLMKDKTTGMPVSQYDMKAAEDIGLVKMDLLGLRTLSLISEALRNVNIIRAEQGLEPLDERRLPEDQKEAFELISRGETAGVFQLEGSGITSAARQMRPQGINDVIALGALYRPGPMENIPTYVRRMHGQEPVEYRAFQSIEDRLRPILDDTYGIPVYQEQIMQIASDVAGYTLGQADLLRRAMGKKIKAEMDQQRELFLANCDERQIPRHESEALFALLDKFAAYGFNRSHAAAYGLLSYHTAYLKANWPAAFMAALLTVEQNSHEKVAQYVSEARRMGLEVLPPDINASEVRFSARGKQILFGLSAIRGISPELTNALIDARKLGASRSDKSVRPAGPFKDLSDLISVMPPEFRKSNVLESLINAGALDAFGERHVLVHNLEPLLKQTRNEAKMGVPALFERQDSALNIPGERPTRDEVLAREHTALGLYISGHPLDVAPEIHRTRSCTLGELEELMTRRVKDSRGKVHVLISGIVSEVRRTVAKASGKAMAIVKLSDETGAEVEAVMFNQVWESQGKLIAERLPLAMHVTLSYRNDTELSVAVEQVITREQAQKLDRRRVVLYGEISPDLNAAQRREVLLSLEEAVTSSEGEMPAEIDLNIGAERQLIRLKTLVSPELITRAEQLSWITHGRVEFDDEGVIDQLRANRPRKPSWSA